MKKKIKNLYFSWSCSFILNKTRNFFHAPAPDCLCPAGLPFWSSTLFLNRTRKNILLLCNVFFPGSLHPLQNLKTKMKKREKNKNCEKAQTSNCDKAPN